MKPPRALARLRRAARRIAVLRLLVRTLRPYVDPHHRALGRINRAVPGALLQPAATTGEDRYPAIFDFVAAQLRDNAQARVLSYGCSTGQELIALRRRLPLATIVGADINPRSLARARRRLTRAGDGATVLRQCRSPADLVDLGPFDAVLCLAVLRHGDLGALMPDSCAAILSFDRVAAVSRDLAAMVRPGGLVALWHVHFRFDDMVPAGHFAPVLRLADGARANRPLYGADNRRLDQVVHDAAVYRRVGGV